MDGDWELLTGVAKSFQATVEKQLQSKLYHEKKDLFNSLTDWDKQLEKVKTMTCTELKWIYLNSLLTPADRWKNVPSYKNSDGFIGMTERSLGLVLFHKNQRKSLNESVNTELDRIHTMFEKSPEDGYLIHEMLCNFQGKSLKRLRQDVFGANPKWACNLHTWGEAGVVKDGKNAKIGNHGTTMMFIGYPTDRESDSVRMWDLTTNQVVVTCDVIWLKCMHFERAVDDRINDYDFSAGEDAVEDVSELEDTKPVAEEADHLVVSAPNESEDAEKNANLDQISSVSAKGQM